MTEPDATIRNGWNVQVRMAKTGDPDIDERRDAAGRAFAQQVLKALRETPRPEGFEDATITRQKWLRNSPPVDGDDIPSEGGSPEPAA